MKQKNDTPPLLGEKILKFFLPKGESVSVAGDYEELYTEIFQYKGKSKALIWYWIQILKSIWAGLSFNLWWSVTMFRSYLTVAVRHLKRHKIYSFINISGLAIGIACCVLILMWINDEVRYDRFHDFSKDLYRVVNDLDYGPVSQISIGSAYPLGPAMKEDIPEVRDIARILPTRRLLVAFGEKRYYEENFIFADPSLFSMFTFPFVKGDYRTALEQPSSIVITQEMAYKYFGLDDPIGKRIQTQNQNDYIVTGVVEDVPVNSHLQFDFVASLERAVAMGGRTHWTGWLYTTYVWLHPNTSYEAVNIKLESWIETKDSEAARYYLQPLSDIHLYGLVGEGMGRPLSFFSILAFFILIIACINYMNLATARAGTRAKEIGLRKVVGAKKTNILKQFLSESVLFAFFALLISIVLVGLFLPVFNQIAGKELSLNLIENKFLLFGILGVTLLAGILAGSYPAFFVSSFEPDRIFKGTLSAKKIGASRAYLRKGLVIFQFVLTIVLLVSTVTVYKQMDFINNRRLGFDKDHLIYMQLRSEGNLWDQYDAQTVWSKYKSLQNELRQNPDILEVSAATCLPFGNMGSEFGGLDWEGKDEEFQVTMYHMAVDSKFFTTFGLELMDGRFLSEEFVSDSSNFILNEAAVKVAGLESPVGKRFQLLDKSGVVAGVIKDFHFTSLHNRIEPLILHLMPYQYWMYRNYVFVRIRADKAPQTLASLKQTWNRIIPEFPFEFTFIDETIDTRYRVEQRLEKILRIFTVLAIAISCFGLFGLISFSAQQRTKEIGIRKILGAPMNSVVRLLSREFIILVLWANIVAWPIAYIVMMKWLNNFAYKTGIGIKTFVFSGLAAMVITILTVGVQSVRAALSNPVDSLRYE